MACVVSAIVWGLCGVVGLWDHGIVGPWDCEAMGSCALCLSQTAQAVGPNTHMWRGAARVQSRGFFCFLLILGVDRGAQVLRRGVAQCTRCTELHRAARAGHAVCRACALHVERGGTLPAALRATA